MTRLLDGACKQPSDGQSATLGTTPATSTSIGMLGIEAVRYCATGVYALEADSMANTTMENDVNPQLLDIAAAPNLEALCETLNSMAAAAHDAGQQPDYGV